MLILIDVQLMAYIDYSAGARIQTGSLGARLKAFAGVKSATLRLKTGQKPSWYAP